MWKYLIIKSWILAQSIQIWKIDSQPNLKTSYFTAILDLFYILKYLF